MCRVSYVTPPTIWSSKIWHMQWYLSSKKLLPPDPLFCFTVQVIRCPLGLRPSGQSDNLRNLPRENFSRPPCSLSTVCPKATNFVLVFSHSQTQTRFSCNTLPQGSNIGGQILATDYIQCGLFTTGFSTVLTLYYWVVYRRNNFYLQLWTH